MVHDSGFGVGGPWIKVGRVASHLSFFLLLLLFPEKKMPKQGSIGLKWIAS